MALTKMGDFTFDHTTQADTPARTPAQLKADWNIRGTDLKTALNGLIDELDAALFKPTCKVYRDSSYSINSGAYTKIPFNVEISDNDTIHNNSTNTERLTCNTEGLYLIKGQINFDTNGTGTRILKIVKNGDTVLAANSTEPSSSFITGMEISTVVNLIETDYVELYAFQSSGSALNVLKTIEGIDFTTSLASPLFMMVKLGEAV